MAKRAALEGHRLALAEAAVEAGEVALGSRAALAAWVGTHRSQITRAAEGQEIGGEAGWRLTVLAAIVTALLAIYEPAAVSGWLHGSNPHLGDRRPLDVLAEGDVTAVMAAVQATRTGAFA
ncbi:MAG TPA: antitoxin Xre/MbcA/ParS toxin-binding domain-containing protein [Gemmatimonadaceae bacterium]|jgi:uncharacterized protein (DUF2384 family)